jgi:hypothetical protein
MKIKVSFFFAWYDFWGGWFYDRERKILYVCPLPCCVFKFSRNLTMRAVDDATTERHGRTIDDDRVYSESATGATPQRR